MNKIRIIVVLMLCIGQQQNVKAQSVKEPILAKEIKMMRDKDQKMRKKWGTLAKKGKTESTKFKELTDRIIATDLSNTERMKEIIVQYGWPTYDLVGKSVSVNAWLIVQHADRDPLFQIKCLPLLKHAAEHGQSDLVNYAFLYDRVQIAKGKKQLYATQSTTNNGITDGYFQPIEDEANVQNRRAEMGFDLHVETYAKKLGFEYKIPSVAEAKEKSDEFEKTYKLNIRNAKTSMESKDYSKAADYYVEALKSYGSVQTADFVEAARAQALSKHSNSSWSALLLLKASIRGFKDIDTFQKDEDFEYLKLVSKRNWSALMRTVETLNKNK